MSVILVTHDLGIVAGTCDRVAVLYAGRIMEIGPTSAVFRAPAHAYTLGLMRSVPHATQARKRLPAISGAPPEPGHDAARMPFRATLRHGHFRLLRSAAAVAAGRRRSMPAHACARDLVAA